MFYTYVSDIFETSKILSVFDKKIIKSFVTSKVQKFVENKRTFLNC